MNQNIGGRPGEGDDAKEGRGWLGLASGEEEEEEERSGASAGG